MALGRKNKKHTERLWRPDFRDVQSLPDTKVIRTGFLMNAVAIALTLGVVTLYLGKEYTLQTFSRTVVKLEAQVAGNTSANRQILDDGKRFKETASVVEEVVAFDHQVLDFPVFLQEVSAIRPDSIILSSIEMKHRETGSAKGTNLPFVIDLSGKIEGVTSGTPSQVISSFQKSISELTSAKDQALQMELIRFSRNNELGHFDFTLQVVIPPKSGTQS